MADLDATQKQNVQEVVALLRVIAGFCTNVASDLNGICDSIDQALSKDRLHVEKPGQGILKLGDVAETTVESSFLNRFTATTLSANLFPGRTVDHTNCADLAAMGPLLGTLTHETFHRRCDADPEAYDKNIDLLTRMRNCIDETTPCAQQLAAMLDGQIAAEQTARSGDDKDPQRLKTNLISAGVGVAAAGLAMKTGLTASIVGATQTGGAIGTAGGPAGIAVGVVIGLGFGVATYLLYNPCE